MLRPTYGFAFSGLSPPLLPNSRRSPSLPRHHCCTASPRPPPSEDPAYVRVVPFTLGPPAVAAAVTHLTLLPTSPGAGGAAPKLAFRMALSTAQAMSIRTQLRGGGDAGARPGTHALLLAALRACDGDVAEAAITGMETDVFVGEVRLGGGSGAVLDARPSDAIALALGADAPIYLRKELLERWPVSVGSVEADVKAGLCERLPPGEPDWGCLMRTLDGERSGGGGAREGGEVGGAGVLSFGGLEGMGRGNGDAGLRDGGAGRGAATSTVHATPAARRHRQLARLEALAARLDVAVRLERFQEAAELRDEIDQICPVASLQQQLESAVAREAFGEAADVRDEILRWEETLERWESEGEGVELSAFAAAAFALGVEVDEFEAAGGEVDGEDEFGDDGLDGGEEIDQMLWMDSWDSTLRASGVGHTNGDGICAHDSDEEGSSGGEFLDDGSSAAGRM